MTKTLLSSFAVAAALAAAPVAHAARAVDTGTPNGHAVGALSFDSQDWVAGQVSFATGTTISAIQGHILGGTSGETFDISLFDNAGGLDAGTPLYTTTATFDAQGWNGAGDLGWNVAAGTYWIGFEIQGGDTLGSGSVTGALLDLGAPHPLAGTMFTDNAGFSWQAAPLSFGLQVSTVPWPATASTLLAGLALLAMLAHARRRA